MYNSAKQGVNKMNEIEFDKALSDFLDDEECEKVNESVYRLIRAFTAGWKAAMKTDLKEVMGSDQSSLGHIE